MTDQERIESVEKAIEIVERLSAGHEMRVARLEQLSARIAALLDSEHDHPELAEAIATLERLVAKQRRRQADFSQAIAIQTEVSRNHDESIDELRAGQSEFDRKLDALADAQIRTEDRFAALADAQAETDRKMGALAESQAETDRKMGALAESQTHSDRKLDALIDVVRDLLDGRRPGGGAVI